MPEITAQEVAHLAELARIRMTPEEIDGLTAQLTQIVDAVAKVNEVATDDIPATSHPLPLVNVLRDDVPRPSLTVGEALSGAPEREGDRFRVAPILDEE
jgi:aspartyl-tRNA(Asn)/glutamyl-tRNA(Gln) amidotransferase subunit C